MKLLNFSCGNLEFHQGLKINLNKKSLIFFSERIHNKDVEK